MRNARISSEPISTAVAILGKLPQVLFEEGNSQLQGLLRRLVNTLVAGIWAHGEAVVLSREVHHVAARGLLRCLVDMLQQLRVHLLVVLGLQEQCRLPHLPQQLRRHLAAVCHDCRVHLWVLLLTGQPHSPPAAPAEALAPHVLDVVRLPQVADHCLQLSLGPVVRQSVAAEPCLNPFGIEVHGKLVAVEEVWCNHQEAIAGKLVRQQLKVLKLVAVNVCDQHDGLPVAAGGWLGDVRS
mmetsp:Transcript_15141/g.45677  ORF Transcript_15141/g.45677 Transcript_15141/m.45677 type:complete len:239 (-) Transcript_15141:280-996(-)